tara:strand:+ start:114 stop:461 length:348 start_codon:yes stop_codon:yes gene_type:complete
MGFKLKSGNKTNFKSMGSVAKMYGKSMAKKALVGNQENLPENLKAEIDAAPGKMYGKSMAKKYDSPAKKKTSDAEKQANLLKAIPNEKAYNELSEEDKKGFDKAAKEAGLPTKKA